MREPLQLVEGPGGAVCFMLDNVCRILGIPLSDDYVSDIYVELGGEGLEKAVSLQEDGVSAPYYILTQKALIRLLRKRPADLIEFPKLLSLLRILEDHDA